MHVAATSVSLFHASDVEHNNSTDEGRFNNQDKEETAIKSREDASVSCKFE